jgi:formylglycine-generating enzyme required for sulfatase activity
MALNISLTNRRWLKLPTPLLLSALVLALWLALSAQAAHAARMALVVGNAAYADSPLKNPVNDARAMKGKLASLGFDVTAVENLKRRDIGRTISGFASRIRPGDEVVVFYAGHGLQVKGINYLPAVDADIQTEEDVALNSLNLNTLLDRLDEAKAGVKLLFLDACRNNPYARSFRSSARGLARVQDAPGGTLMHFATRPGSVAADGSGSNGLYTTELLRHIDQPGTPVEQMLKRVAAAVERESKGQQEPWVEGSLKGDFYFKPGPGTQVASVGVVPTGEPAQVQADPEQEAWELAKRRDTVAGFQAYLNRYPSGRYADTARVALEGLQPAPSPRPAQTPQPTQPTQAAAPATQPGHAFKDCADCPEMVVVPAGSFTMGSNESDDEKPPHQVNIRSFALGKFEVTQGQWKAVMGSNPSRFNSCGDNCPVEQTSWNDIQQYIQKLSQQTGKQYRLPSEAEWEYAARAGSTGKWSLGDNESGLGEYAWYEANSISRTWPVGQKQANAFGLHDMHGNVSEWVQDLWHDNYSGAPTDGSAWQQGGDASRHVLRGGSWINSPVNLRSAYRFGRSPGIRGTLFSGFGFRLARIVP